MCQEREKRTFVLLCSQLLRRIRYQVATAYQPNVFHLQQSVTHNFSLRVLSIIIFFFFFARLPLLIY